MNLRLNFEKFGDKVNSASTIQFLSKMVGGTIDIIDQ